MAQRGAQDRVTSLVSVSWSVPVLTLATTNDPERCAVVGYFAFSTCHALSSPRLTEEA